MKAPCVRVARSDGERTRRVLAEADLLDQSLDIDSTEEWLYIPIADPTDVPASYDVVEHEVEHRDQRTTPADLLGFDPSYERLGDLVLLDEDDPDRAETIADAVMASDIPAKTVLNKASKIRGETRVRDWAVLRGNGTETVHREYGCEFALDLASVYFSPRLATERHRVISQIGADERVIDMFAGVGPYAIPGAVRGAEVIAVDINPVAVDYCRENARRNGVEDRVTVVEGDVRDVAEKYADWADRLIMNLPHTAETALNAAVTMAADEAVVHYYDIQSADNPFEPGEAAIRTAAEPAYDVTIENRREVRSYAPHELNVCLDAGLERV